ncbi:nucleoid-associated protein [Campylobacterota bacterium]|nr:nucleoid-associated protein [Campylobacterota bacterium]
MFGNINLGDLGELFSQVQQQAQDIQNAAEDERYTAKSGGGMVKITANGRGAVVDIEIDDSLLGDKDSLQILLIGAINDAITQAEEGKRNAAMQMMGNLGNLKK